MTDAVAAVTCNHVNMILVLFAMTMTLLACALSILTHRTLRRADKLRQASLRDRANEQLHVAQKDQ